MIKTINDPLDPSKGAEESTFEPLEAEGEQKTKHWATDRICGIQSELSNTFYVNTNEMNCRGQSYSAAHSVLRRFVFPENKKRFKIAVCPIAHSDLLQVETYEKNEKGRIQGLFCAKGLKRAQYVYHRIEAAFFAAGRERADIIIFSFRKC